MSSPPFAEPAAAAASASPSSARPGRSAARPSTSSSACPSASGSSALAAGRQASLLEEQARRLRPEIVALRRPEAGVRARAARPDRGDARRRRARRRSRPATTSTSSSSARAGSSACEPVIAALEAGKVVATANKETLVAGGHLVMPLARARAARSPRIGRATRTPSPLAWLRPIDSEHSAIWQCLVGEGMARRRARSS